ncbi:MAG: hypothetical protein RL380_423 [Verrucomicrobiota bacterium]|jgi:uncharacterized protein (DUF983 family)
MSAQPSVPVTWPIPKLKTLVARGLRKKCPQCGEGAVYVRGLKVRENCAHCGLQFLPDQGDLFGPLVFLDRALFLIPFVVLFYFNVWHPNKIIFIGVGALFVGVLIFTTPNRNAVSLALDYLVRRHSGDLVEEPPVAPTQNNPCQPSVPPVDSRPHE